MRRGFATRVYVEQCDQTDEYNVSLDGDGPVVFRGREALHTLLASAGYRRAVKQEGSDIGGVYFRPEGRRGA